MEKATATKIIEYMNKIEITKEEIADKMKISVCELEKILSLSDEKMSLKEFYNIVIALNVSANLFI